MTWQSIFSVCKRHRLGMDRRLPSFVEPIYDVSPERNHLLRYWEKYFDYKARPFLRGL